MVLFEKREREVERREKMKMMINLKKKKKNLVAFLFYLNWVAFRALAIGKGIPSQLPIFPIYNNVVKL